MMNAPKAEIIHADSRKKGFVMTFRLLLACCVFALLAACSRQPADQAKPSPAQAAAPAAAAPAPKIELARPATPPAPPEVAPLAKGRFKNSEWRLTKVRVTRAILTVELQIDGKCCESESMPLDQTSYIDDASAKKFGVLKDDAGQWMAAPLLSNSYVTLQANGGVSTVWIKFPAPPAESKTISLNLPKIGALDGMPVQR